MWVTERVKFNSLNGKVLRGAWLRGREGLTTKCGQLKVLWESGVSLKAVCTLELRRKDRGRDWGKS